MSDWSFRPGKSRLAPPKDVKELEQLVEKADPAYWNGATGVSCFSREYSNDSVHLYVSLAEDRTWHLRYQFADNSYVIAHDPSRNQSPAVTLWIGGNESRIPAEQFVDSETALAIMRQFVATGLPDDMADWRVPASA